jgi:hypothetical protein
MADVRFLLSVGIEVSADEMNHALYVHGMRPCPHGHHDCEDFGQCVAWMKG